MQEPMLEKAYGEEYVAETASEQKQKNDGKNIQDAHEAIRPSDVTRDTGRNQRISYKRPVPSVSADLEAFCGEQNAAGKI